ncbi:ead/Ea22-like family protein [Rahnella inusitata]|uniref:ead/Ea22-like family protein n=1 Tax=Rahnella inusitata TaxID=58169 RepID=UPI0039BE5069
MTDTTDIKALREAALKATAGEWCTDSQHSVIADAGLNANYYVAACSGPDSKINAKFIALANPATIIALLGQLEAERQRADNLVLQVNTQANMREKAEKERDWVVKNYIRVTNERNSALYEVEALKAKLANPVVLTDCTFEAVSHMAHWYSEGECVAWVSGAEYVKKQILEAGFTVKGDL